MRKVIGSGLSEGGIGVFHSKSGSSKKILPINKEGLVFYMPAEKSVWNMVFDCSGKNNHGTRYGAFVTNNGKVGKGLQFDGIDDYIDCGNDESLNIMGDLTIEVWEKSLASTWQGIIERGIYCTGYSIYITKNVWASYGNKGDWFFDGSPSDGEWHHISVVVDRTLETLSVYHNGIKDSNILDITGVTNISSNDFTEIGRGNFGGWYHFKGKIDEIKIYNRALSPEEILADYQREV